MPRLTHGSGVGSIKRLHALLLSLLALLATTGAGPFEETHRQVRFYRTNLRLTQNLIDQQPALPMGSCILLQLPNWLDGIKSDQALLYQRTRLRLAKGLKKLNRETPPARLLKQIPDACQDEALAQKRLKKLLLTQRGAFETVLATTILTLEQYDFKQKAAGFRALYLQYFPNRNMEKEFLRRYKSP